MKFLTMLLGLVLTCSSAQAVCLPIPDVAYCPSGTTTYVSGGQSTSVTYQIFSDQAANYDKLLVVTEGFEIDGDKDKSPAAWFEDLRENKLTPILLKKGIDIVIVSFDDKWNPIPDIAMSTGIAMEEVWQKSLKFNPIVSLGISMGGLVSMWATHINEVAPQGWTFKTGSVITLDSPHRGAVIPSSIQAFMQIVDDCDFEILGVDTGFCTFDIPQYEALTGQAAKQMLLNSIADLPGRNVHFDFMTDYHNLINAAASAGIRKVGVVSGSWIGTPINELYRQRVFHGHDNPFGCGKYEFNMWTQSENPSGRDRVAELQLDFCNVAQLDEKRNDYISINVENAPGGVFYTYEKIYDALKDRVPGREIGPVTLDLSQNPEYFDHAFVPTLSAAGLDYESDIFPQGLYTNLGKLENEGSVDMEAYSFLDKIYHHPENEGNMDHGIPTLQQGAEIIGEIDLFLNDQALVATVILPLLLK